MEIPFYYVLTPDDTTPAGIEYARRWFARNYRPAAGVWSVESGEFKPGYHLNVIADRVDIRPGFKGHIYAEPIRSTVRAVAAYMTKAERAATRAQGFHRQTGDLGPAANWLRTALHDAPVVAAAQALHDLAPGHIPPSAPGPEDDEATARRWLEPVFAASREEKEAAPKVDSFAGALLRFRLAAKKRRAARDAVFTWPQPAPPRHEPHPTSHENARKWIAVLRATLDGRPPPELDPDAGPAPPPVDPNDT
jgi:hypothetical protein